MLWTTLIVLGCLILGFVIFVLLQPGAFTVTRRTNIAAPPVVPFAMINDFQEWDHWSPWAKLDPQCKNTVSNPSAGEGATYHWLGNKKVGEGKMTILESAPPERLEIKLQFIKPFACTNTAEFVFKPASSGTELTWNMYGNNGFMGKLFGVFMNFDKMIGADFEKGLAAIKARSESGLLAGSSERTSI